MMEILKSIWAAWKRFAYILGKIQTTILLTLIYFLIIPFFSLVRLKDPLSKRLEGSSYWQAFKKQPTTLEQFQKMF